MTKSQYLISQGEIFVEFLVDLLKNRANFV